MSDDADRPDDTGEEAELIVVPRRAGPGRGPHPGHRSPGGEPAPHRAALAAGVGGGRPGAGARDGRLPGGPDAGGHADEARRAAAASTSCRRRRSCSPIRARARGHAQRHHDGGDLAGVQAGVAEVLLAGGGEPARRGDGDDVPGRHAVRSLLREDARGRRHRSRRGGAAAAGDAGRPRATASARPSSGRSARAAAAGPLDRRGAGVAVAPAAEGRRAVRGPRGAGQRRRDPGTDEPLDTATKRAGSIAPRPGGGRLGRSGGDQPARLLARFEERARRGPGRPPPDL